MRAISYKPSVASFADFDIGAEELPIVSFVGDDEEWTTNEKAIEDALGGKGVELNRRVEEGFWVVHDDDRPVLANRWLLVWQRLSSGQPSKRAPWFLQLSGIVVTGGFSWASDGLPQNVVLASETVSPPPFNPRELRFRKAFDKVLRSPVFSDLRDNDVPGEAWHFHRQQKTRQFWSAVKQEYLSAV
ncbi:hypothetical protein EOB36_27975 [Mesorhizobium sp. M6A.T.Cr.TU.017.01.1.1]|uniref:hypothetical protein n=1 Tax=Mesorhizobium sp. M6A.T.Cr.TU.017.01.1.1 TaxID=2496774 RepID=UPI000FD265FA|nr:hypothetical protein [Mesorhizobium sp. M6A.T.Cr.TU.017.01.1.1]RUU97101.1 hypothetical protein EOB36_27975 [Mesorhizobium sp. M6A.T.Cr.TU.017.01.1.1]